MSVEVMSGGGSANLQSKVVTPAFVPCAIKPDSGYDGFSSLSVGRPSTLIASNIKSGVDIFGQVGTLKTPQYYGKSYIAEQSNLTRKTLTLTSAVDTGIYPFSDEQTINLVSFTIIRKDTSSGSDGIIFLGAYDGLGQISASSPSITPSKMMCQSGLSFGVVGGTVSIAFSGNNVTVTINDQTDYFSTDVPYAAVAYWTKVN